MMRLAVAFFLALGCLKAASTAAWEMSSYQDFVRGKFEGLALSRDGRITVAPQMETIFASNQPAIWSVLQTPDGLIYVGTGHRGRVYSIDRAGKSTLVWTAPQPEVFALARGSDGSIYAGTSPNGKVYRLMGGQATEYFTPDAKYIWALQTGADGSLYIGTGAPGRIYRVTGVGKGEVYFESGQSHITCLGLDGKGALLAGSEPNGLLYRISGKDKAFVLYDSSLPEIRAISAAPDGSIYAAAMGGTLAQKTPVVQTAPTPTTPAQVTAPGTSITVTDESAAQAGSDLKPKPDQNKPPVQAAPQITTVVLPAPLVEVAGAEKSAVFRINTDNTVETLWSSKEENVYDLLLRDNQVLFSTDGQGRVYQLSGDRHVTLLAQTNEGEALRILPRPNGLLVATSTMGKLLSLTARPDAHGTYEAPVHDATTVARWGSLSWRGQRTHSTKLRFQTRTGNSARPDNTWSEWSEPLTEPGGAPLKSPNARFIQWRAELTSSNGETPSITGVTLTYLPQNTPPLVRSINVTTQLAATPAQKSATGSQASNAAYSITVTDTGDASSSSVGTASQALGRTLSQQILISWQADDPDGDRLVYAVYFRGEEEQRWKLLRSNFWENSLTLDGEVFADGKYLFRVVASDKLSNPGASARESELISQPIVFDNTPPVVKAGAPVRQNGGMKVEVDASDAASPLRRAEYSLDAATWVPLEAADGIIDSQSEHFTLTLDALSAGEHLIVIRVYDSANNAGLARVLVR